MIACGVDCSELWVANETRFPRRSGILQVTDLFLNERRELENGGRLDASSSGSSVSTSSRNKSSSDAYSKSRGIGGCFRSLEEGDEYNDDGNINAVRNGMSSLSMRVSEKPRGAITVMTKGSGVCAALLFVGTSAGDVCVWDVDLGKGNENAVMKVRKGVSATAMSIVDDEEEESNDDDDDDNDNDLVRGEEENGTNEVRAFFGIPKEQVSKLYALDWVFRRFDIRSHGKGKNKVSATKLELRKQSKHISGRFLEI